jgi:tetratricopeptide (TPR) repeat protein
VRIHLHDLLLQEFAASFPEDRADCLEHLIQCPDCRNRFRQLLHSPFDPLARKVVSMERWQAGPPDYEPGLDRLYRQVHQLQSAYEKEKAEAPRLLAELFQHSPEKRSLLAHNCSRFHSWALCELLLQHSQEENYHNVAVGEGLALLVLDLVDCLDFTYYRPEAIESLRARAWARVANSRRLKADLRGAEEAFALAFAGLKRGTRDPMDRAVLFDLQASLLRDQRRFAKAHSLLRRAAAIFRALGERHRAGRVLVSMSIVHYTSGEVEKCIPLLYEALELIDPAREPRLVVVTWHNLITYLAEMGQFMAAQRLFAKTRGLYRQFPEPWLESRRKWVEGSIVRGLGRDQQAEALFLEARDGFLTEGAAYDTALVSLDLASLYAEQGRITELKRIAAEMLPIFSSRQIHREALAALAFWRQAVEAEKACVNLAADVASFLKRARHDPELRFQPE